MRTPERTDDRTREHLDGIPRSLLSSLGGECRFQLAWGRCRTPPSFSTVAWVCGHYITHCQARKHPLVNGGCSECVDSEVSVLGAMALVGVSRRSCGPVMFCKSATARRVRDAITYAHYGHHGGEDLSSRQGPVIVVHSCCRRVRRGMCRLAGACDEVAPDFEVQATSLCDVWRFQSRTAQSVKDGFPSGGEPPTDKRAGEYLTWHLLNVSRPAV